MVRVWMWRFEAAVVAGTGTGVAGGMVGVLEEGVVVVGFGFRAWKLVMGLGGIVARFFGRVRSRLVFRMRMLEQMKRGVSRTFLYNLE